MIPIIDSHLDLSWNALSWNRDLTQSVAETRAIESAMTDSPARGKNTVSLPDMRRGNVGVCLATILVRARPELHPAAGFKRTDLDFRDQIVACATGRGQLEYYRLVEERREIRFIRSAAELRLHWEEWALNREKCPIGIILSMEGADPIVEPAQVSWWFEAGLRTVGLVHYGKGPYAVGTGDSGELTSKGVELLREFRRVGMILDLTHCSDPSFFQAIEIFDGPVFASHNNCRALVPGDRQYSDEQIKLIVERDGVIGAALDSWMLYPNWRRGQTPREAVTLSSVADHIDHICQLAGNTRHVGIGSDLDGGFGTEQSPADLDTIADLQKLEPILKSRGYSEDDIRGIFHGNYLRFFNGALP